MRGQTIYQLGQVEPVDYLTYHVNSQSGHEVQKQVVIKPLDHTICVFCGSETVVKHGLRRNKNGAIQRFTCKTCGKRFTRNLGFEKLKATPQIVTCALQLYFTGESLRNVQRLLKLQGVNVTHQTVYNWIKRYVALMQKYLDKITPQVSPVWRADELYIKIKGNMKYQLGVEREHRSQRDSASLHQAAPGSKHENQGYTCLLQTQKCSRSQDTRLQNHRSSAGGEFR